MQRGGSQERLGRSLGHMRDWDWDLRDTGDSHLSADFILKPPTYLFTDLRTYLLAYLRTHLLTYQLTYSLTLRFSYVSG